MVIDAAKGIEAQTRKLFEVCRLRGIPIITFINKIDREALSPFALLDEIADKLALDTVPMSWPLGMGGTFRGIYAFEESRAYIVDRVRGALCPNILDLSGLDDPNMHTALTNGPTKAIVKKPTPTSG